MNRLPSWEGQSESMSGWKTRIRDALPVFQWTIPEIQELQPSQVRLTKQKFRNRHFLTPLSQLKAGITISPPTELSLFSTSDFFVRLLPPDQYKLLKQTALNLHGRTLRIATTCSGSDIGSTAVKSMIKRINREFKVTWDNLVQEKSFYVEAHWVTENIFICTYTYVDNEIVSKCGISEPVNQVNIRMEHVFSAELDPDKRAYILEAFEDVKHVFGDVECFSRGEGWCFRCCKNHSIDESMTVDVLLAGPSCKDLSFFEFAYASLVYKF